MAVKVTALTRTFTYAGVDLGDPGANLSPDQVRAFFTASFAELNNADTNGPITRGNKLCYTFVRNVEVKG